MPVTQRSWRAQTRANFGGNRQMQKEMKEGLEDLPSLDPSNPYNVAFRIMGETYRSFLRQHFNESKAGGGAWPAIKKSTKRWRLRRYGITHTQILYVTRTLYGLTAKKYDPTKGHYEKRTKYGITVGAAGYNKHPDYPGSILAAVKAHAKGNPAKKVPKRVIFIPATQNVIAKMGRSMDYAHRKVTAKANRKFRPKKNT